jgi:hypothetical protein
MGCWGTATKKEIAFRPANVMFWLRNRLLFLLPGRPVTRKAAGTGAATVGYPLTIPAMTPYPVNNYEDA